MAHCPSCARYVGPYEACPYCGARMQGRVPMKLIKLAAALLATVGLVVLWYVATHVEIPTIAIGQVDAGMNLAYVRVAGRCTRSPSYDPQTGYLSFWLSDDTGELRVASYRAGSQRLIEQQRVPALGDRIAVAGTLRVEDQLRTLTINAPEQLVISRDEPLERAIGSIRLADHYQRIRVRGQVRDVRKPHPRLTLLTLQDVTGVIDVALSADLIALTHNPPTFEVGQSVEVVAAVSHYGDAVQLVPASAADIIPLDLKIPIALERSIVEITGDEAGHWFSVRGTVASVRPFSAGVKMRLEDATGAITVLLWQDAYEALVEYLGDGPRPTPGARIRVQGNLSEYRGELELMPALATDIEILTVPGPPQMLPIGALSAEDVGRWVRVRGTLGTPERFSAGLKIPLSDDSGSLTLLLWEEVYAALPVANQLAAGVEVEVMGEIDEYRGDLEIAPGAEGVLLVE